MRLFEPSDLPEMNSWYSARGQAVLPLSALPEMGLIEPHVAAGFLFRTDAPGLAMLDAFVSNPSAPLRARAEAISAIATRLLESAKHQGVRHLVALCKSRGIERLADRMRFRTIGVYAMAGLEL